MLGGSSIASFLSGTLSPGAFANSASVTLPAGTYYFTISPNFQPGNSSNATFSNIIYYVRQ